MSGLCRALLRDRAEAEDAAQQTFLSAHRAIANGSEPRESAAWVATIARNECWARIRSRMREPLATGDADTEASSADPVAEAIRRADLAALWSAIRALPPNQREALLLREFGGLSYEELAAALAVSAPAVESLLFRARQGIRTRLETAYAAFSGAGWAEWAARLLAGGSAPAAAKVAAVGMSAAVATGGAVVAPRVARQAPKQEHRQQRQRATPPPAAASIAPAPALVVHTVAAVSRPAAPRPSGADEHARSQDEHAQSHDEHAQSQNEHGDAITRDRSVSSPHEQDQPEQDHAEQPQPQEPDRSGDAARVPTASATVEVPPPPAPSAGD